MRRLEQLVVQVEAALSAVKAGDEAHLRLGLVLLDSAAEVLLHRSTAWFIFWNQRQRARLEGAEVGLELMHPDKRSKAEEGVERLRQETMSRRKIQELERNFDAKTALLAKHGQMDPGLTRVLRKLHQYRNEIYHRDSIRHATLKTAAELYADVVLRMMLTLTPSTVSWTPSIPPGLGPYLDKSDALGLDSQETVARQLMASSGLVLSDAPRVLAEHATSRLDGIVEDLAFCAESLPDEAWDPEATLRLVQIDPRRSFSMDVAAIRATSVPVTLKTITSWRADAEQIRTCTDGLSAFANFADLEDCIEPTEHAVRDLLQEIEGSIQLQIDIARGK